MSFQKDVCTPMVWITIYKVRLLMNDKLFGELTRGVMSKLFVIVVFCTVNCYKGVCNLARTRESLKFLFFIFHNWSFWQENAQCGVLLNYMPVFT